MAQFSAGFFEDDEQDDADALPMVSEQRASQDLRSPEFQLEAPEPAPPAPAAEIPAPVVTPAPQLPAAPQPRQHQALVDPVANAQLLQQEQRAEAQQQAGYLRFLKDSGVETSLLPDGSEVVATHEDGAPKWREDVSEPLQNDSGRWVKRYRTNRGETREIDLLTPGQHHRDSATGQLFTTNKAGERIVLGTDDAYLQQRALKAARVALGQQDQAERLAVDQMRADLQQPTLALKNYQRMSTDYGTVRDVERSLMSHRPGLDKDADAEARDMATSYKAWLAQNPEYRTLKDAVEQGHAEIATREQRMRERQARALLLSSSNQGTAVASLLPPNLQPKAPASTAPGEASPDDVDDAATRLAIEKGIPHTEALKATAADLKAKGVTAVGSQRLDDIIAKLEAIPQETAKDEPSFLADAGKGLLRGVVSEGFYAGVAGIARGAANSLRNVAPYASNLLKQYADATEDVRADVRKSLASSEKFDQSLVGKITVGLGQLGGTLPTYVIPGFGPLHSIGQIYDEGYQDALQRTGDPETAHRTALKYLPAAALDIAADRLIIGKILKPLKGKMSIGQFLTHVAVAAAGEGATEGAQQLYLNSIAKYLEGYDPQRKLDDEVVDSIIVGAVAGGAATAVGAGVTSLAAPQSETVPPSPETQAAPGVKPNPAPDLTGNTSPAPEPANPAPPPVPAASYTDTLAKVQDVRAKLITAKEAGDTVTAATLRDEGIRLQGELHSMAKTAVETVPFATRKQMAKAISPDVDVEGNENFLASDQSAWFATTQLGREMRGQYLTPERQAAISTITSRDNIPPALAETIVDQHVGMQVARDLRGVLNGGLIEQNKAAILDQMGLLEQVDDGNGGTKYAVSDDALGLFLQVLREQVKRDPQRFNLAITPGTPADGLAILTRAGQDRFGASLQSAEPQAPAAEEKPYRVKVRFSASDGVMRTTTLPVRATSDTEAIAKATAIGQRHGRSVYDVALEGQGTETRHEDRTSKPPELVQPRVSAPQRGTDTGRGSTPDTRAEYVKLAERWSKLSQSGRLSPEQQSDLSRLFAREDLSREVSHEKLQEIDVALSELEGRNTARAQVNTQDPAAGNVRAVHHSNAEISVFDDARLNPDDNDRNYYGLGHYFAAEGQTTDAGGTDLNIYGRNRHDVELDIRNPFKLRLDSPKKAEKADYIDSIHALGDPQLSELIDSGKTLDMDTIRKEVGPKRFTEILKANGYDGVEVIGERGRRDYVAFTGKQVRVAEIHGNPIAPNLSELDDSDTLPAAKPPPWVEIEDETALSTEARQAAAIARRQFIGNRDLFQALGVSAPVMVHLANRDVSGIAISRGQLIIDPELVAEQVSAIQGLKASPEAWVREAMVEEFIHLAQFASAGKEFVDLYSAVWNDPNLPDGLREAAGETYVGFDQLSDAAKGAEMVRMVIQGRWRGTITEAVIRALKKIVDFLRGIDVTTSPLLDEAVQRTETVLNWARTQAESQKANTRDVTPSDTGTQKVAASKTVEPALSSSTVQRVYANANPDEPRPVIQWQDDSDNPATRPLTGLNRYDLALLSMAEDYPEDWADSDLHSVFPTEKADRIRKLDRYIDNFDKTDPSTWMGESDSGVAQDLMDEIEGATEYEDNQSLADWIGFDLIDPENQDTWPDEWQDRAIRSREELPEEEADVDETPVEVELKQQARQLLKEQAPALMEARKAYIAERKTKLTELKNREAARIKEARAELAQASRELKAMAKEVRARYRDMTDDEFVDLQSLSDDALNKAEVPEPPPQAQPAVAPPPASAVPAPAPRPPGPPPRPPGGAPPRPPANPAASSAPRPPGSAPRPPGTAPRPPRPPGMLGASRVAQQPAFYSQLERVVDRKMPARAPVAQVRAILDPAKGSGIKQDELDWAGVDQFLEGKQTVTKGELLDFIRSNQVELKEVQKRTAGDIDAAADRLVEAGYDIMDGGVGLIDSDGNEVDADTLPENLRRAFDVVKTGIDNEVRYQDYRLPGGRNYKEVLLTLPTNDSRLIEERKRLAEIDRERPLTPEEDARYQELRNLTEKGNSVDFRSSHWDEPNVLAHIRHADFRDTDGKKVRVIEEIQSDWHQKGRKEGYATKPDTTGLTAEKATPVPSVYNPNPKPVWRIFDAEGNQIARIDDGSLSEQEAIKAGAEQAVKAKGGDAVPDAPFKKSWAELSFKKALRQAVEDGVDKLAWVTGDIAADRFDISKKVDRVQYDENMRQLWGYKDGSRVISQKEVTPDKLPDYVGKEVAERLMQQEPKVVQAGDHDYSLRELSGENLKVGGAGMKGFYDKIIPDFVRKYVKKWGATVGVTTIPITSRETVEQRRDGYWYVVDGVTPVTIGYATREEAEAQQRKSGDVTLHSVDITPAMRASVMDEGQPLFASKVKPTDNPSLFSSATDEQTTTKEPDERLFFGPIVRFSLGRVFLGAADVLEKTPGLEFLGKAVRKHVDTARRLQGQMNQPFRLWEQKYGRDERKQALKEFEEFQKYNDADRKDDAFVIVANASEAGKKLIRLWQDAAESANEINKEFGLQVFDSNTGKFRPIGTVQDYFPRSVKPEIMKLLQDPTKNLKRWREVVNALIAEGHIENKEQAHDFLSRTFNATKSFDYLGHIEAARQVKLPTMMYDYSFEAARRYLNSWAERQAQIQAYGQAVGKNGKDLFDEAIEKTVNKGTQEYIAAVRDRAYGVTPNSFWMRVAGVLNQIATATMLTNPVTIGANLFTGLGYTAASMGMGHSFKGMIEMRKAGQLINDAFAKGILQDNLSSMMEDADALDTSWRKRLSDGTAALLKWTGYNLSEDFVRAHGLATARSFLREAKKANERNPDSRTTRQYRDFFERHHIDAEALLTENGEGAKANEFFRSVLNAAQGGYRFDQVPVYADTPVGRFLFKFGKWGLQQTRFFALHVLNPLRKGNVAPMVRYLALTAVIGGGLDELKELLFGTPDRNASWQEVGKTLKEDQLRALELVTGKIYNSMLSAGAFGALANYAQTVRDISERSRFKNPLEPAGLASLKNAGEFAMRWWEQGKLTPKDLNDFLRAQVSLYRTSESASARGLDTLGSDFKWKEIEMRRQDMQWLGVQTRRYADEIGVEASRTSMGRVAKTAESPVTRRLFESLAIGDTEGARKATQEFLAPYKSPKDRNDALKRLQNSVRNRQPIRVGASSEARRELFMRWAERRLPKEDLERVRDIDRTYRRTATALRLMKPEERQSAAELQDAMRRITAKNRAGVE